MPLSCTYIEVIHFIINVPVVMPLDLQILVICTTLYNKLRGLSSIWPPAGQAYISLQHYPILQVVYTAEACQSLFLPSGARKSVQSAYKVSMERQKAVKRKRPGQTG